jgi:hypothetical protein
MLVGGNNQGNAVILVKDAARSCPPDDTINTFRLDTYWKDVLKEEQPFLVKMDIQIHEPFAVRGGLEMFKKAPPLVIYLEC